jgi:hypothetical protein
VLGAIYPSGASARLSLGICDLDVRDYLRDMFATVPLAAAFMLRVAIWMVALAPPFVLRRITTVLGLAADERQSLISRLASSSSYLVRQLIVALKAVGGLFFGASPGVRESIFGPEHLEHPAGELISVDRIRGRSDQRGDHVERSCA